MRSSAGASDQQQRFHQPQPPPPPPPQPSDLNLSDVIEVIRHTDPATFQEFQNHLSAMSAAAAAAAAVSSPSKAELAKMKRHAHVKIVEQPASKGLRFRYECEGRSAGSIPGASSTAEHKTYPTIQVVGYRGRAVVVVSCVSADAPHRPHPHNLVGKEGCKKGVCTLEIPADTMTISFPSLGVQCVKKKEIEEALALRQEIRVDPFQTGFSHKDNAQSLDLNCVRLCFQVFLEGNEKGAFTFALKPVVSEPIFDKKAKTELTICRMTEFSASVAGGRDMLLFCDKVVKDDIQVRFFEEDDSTGKLLWEGLGEFQPSDVHKQYGIAFRTPRYHNLEIESPVKVRIQLRRPSDGAVSESRNFEFLPLDSGRSFWTTKRLKTNYNIFNSILSADGQQQIRTSASTLPGSSVATAVVAASADELKRKIRMPTRNLQLQQSQQQQVVLQPSQLASHPMRTSLQFTPQVPTPQQQQISPSSTSTASSSSSATMHRPLSCASDVSSTATACTVDTKASVNEILSMAADAEDMSVYSLDLNNEAMSFGALMKMDPVAAASSQQQQAPVVEIKQERNSGVMEQQPLGSLTSVATVKENPANVAAVPVQAESTTNSTEAAMDVDALYDDVMQCVYDDVAADAAAAASTTANNNVDEETPPPAPPIRKRNMSIVDLDTLPVEEEAMMADKPLPGTPSKIPTIINKVIGGGTGTLKRESREEKERRKREKEEKERKEKEDKLREKEEKERAKAEKAKEKEEKKKKAVESKNKEADESGPPGKQSLFQRLFTRSKSLNAEDELNANEAATGDVSAPAVPSHRSTIDLSTSGADGNANSVPAASAAPEPTEAELNDLQQFLDSGNLDHLDNMVTEFAKQYMHGGEADDDGTASKDIAAAAVAGQNNNGR